MKLELLMKIACHFKESIMYDNVKVHSYILALVVSLVTLTVTAGERPSGISQQIINTSALKDASGRNLTAVLVKLDPGASVPSHTHAGFVFVYLLEGTVRSQLNHGEIVKYTAGQSWTEPPGTIHSLSHNPSTTDKAKLLAVFVVKDGEKLTNFGVNQ